MSDTATPRPDTSDMASVHKVFRSSLASAPDLVSSAAGDDERRALIANYYANLISFLESHHEGEEAIIFPRLAERAPAQRAVVDKAQSQHAQVVDLVHAARHNVSVWETAGDDGAAGLVQSLQALSAALVPHLDEEEAVIVPLAGEYMTVEEWGMLPGHALGTFGGDKVWLILGLIRENFTPQQRDTMLEHMPPPARQMWETMGEASFNDLIAEVRRSG
ncbi:MAG: hemerythrin domain-containing protein [Acidimicrobiales bacterium]